MGRPIWREERGELIRTPRRLPECFGGRGDKILQVSLSTKTLGEGCFGAPKEKHTLVKAHLTMTLGTETPELKEGGGSSWV